MLIECAAEKLLTPMEVSVRLGYQSKTSHSVLRIIKRGELPAVYLNSRAIRVRESALNDFIHNREGGKVYA